MPDSKITALTALTSADPANDMFPIVDVSDTSMAASGTTKRISINNLLAASGTATLASATISGDLTVDTSTLKVNSSSNTVAVGTASSILNGVLSVAQQVASGVGSTTLTLDHYNANNKFIQFGWYGASIGSIGQNSGTFLEIDSPIIGFKISGTEAMRLNSTGLAIGDTAFAGTRLTLRESASQPNALAMTNRNATQTWRIGVDVSAVDDKILGFYDSTSTAFRLQLYDAGHLISTVPTTPPTLALNSTAVWNLTSNTNLRVSVRGTDGVTRTANITLA